MSNPAPLCTHIKTNGVRCGSPAVRGTTECFHHSAVKTALGKVTPLEKVSYGASTSIPFIFPEDRASMQINYFLLLQAINEQRIERKMADLMLRMLKAMDKNLGKSGSLVDPAMETAGQQDEAPTSPQGTGQPHPEPQTDPQPAPEPEPQPVDEAFAYINKVISEVNAGAAGYAEYREVSAPNQLVPRLHNTYRERPMGR